MDSALDLLAQAGGGVDNPLINGTFLDSKYFNPDFWFGKEVAVYQTVTDPQFTTTSSDIYHGILIFLTMFFITVICYCAVRMFEIRKKEHDHLHHEIAEYAHKQRERDNRKGQGEEISKNPRWVTTINYLFSGNESDWKLAVIEADSMLEQLLEQLGFKGETLGDKLKSADQDSFRSLTKAWEVHTVRNKIAHEGVAFPLSQHEAKRVIAIYEHIFKGYGFI